MGWDYLPLRQMDLQPWARNFVDRLSGDPAAYQVSEAEVQALAEAVGEYEHRLRVACEPETRTVVAIFAKDRARQSLTRLLRALAQRIKRTPGVSGPLKADLGITIPAASASPVAWPSTRPLLQVVECPPQRHILRFADVATSNKRAKPVGVAGLQLYCHVGDNPPKDWQEWRFVGLATRQPFHVDFPSRDVGKTAHYVGRWQTRRGRTGPWSGIAVRTVAA